MLFVFQEISQNPQLFVGGASRFDIKQGDLGEYSLSTHSELIQYSRPCSVLFNVFHMGVKSMSASILDPDVASKLF